jgi:hypothetical protein
VSGREACERTTRLFPADLEPVAAIGPDVAHRLATAFGLTVANVRGDARDVATWVGPHDVLLAAIERRRRLASACATTYLETLRRVLA